MFGFFVGTLCLVGLVGVLKGGRGCGPRARWGHPGMHHGWGHHHGFGHHGGHQGWRASRWEGGRGGEAFRDRAGRAMNEILKRKLRIDEDQEGIVDHALKDLHASIHAFGDDLKGGRDELAGAFRGEQVDEAALDALFARWDEDLRRTRREVVSALKQVHAVLDEEQRAAAAELLASSGPKGWVL